LKIVKIDFKNEPRMFFFQGDVQTARKTRLFITFT
jgi:hypothetical protein